MKQQDIDSVWIELYSRWKEFTLTEMGTLKRGKSKHRPRYAFHLYGGPYPFIQTGQIREASKYITKYEQTYSEAGLAQSKLWNKDTLCITIAANIAEIAILSFDACFPDSVLGFIPDKNKCDLNFVFYTLKYFQKELQQMGDGSVQDNINLGTFEQIKFPFPPLPEQTAIASILSSLDDKIDLLHRQNKTLEQLAETLFRSYFPMTNEENKYVELGNYVDCINGVSYKSSELNPSKVGMVSLKSFDRNGGFSIDGFKEFTGKFKEKQEVVEGDLIVAHTDITQDAEVIGNPALVISNPNFDTMTISMDIVKVISKVDWISIEFLYFLMRTREFKSHCEGCANGSTVLHLNKQAIPTFEFPKPDKTKIADFTKQAREIVNKIFLNHRQLRSLVKTRDTLLPKLMSGEVRFKN